MEDAWLGKATERLFLPLLRMMLPELVDINLPVEGVFHNMAIVAIDKQYPCHGRKIMHALWGMGQLMFTKCIVVVDKDVNVQDVAEVAWRVLNNIDPKRDVMISDGPVRRARPRVVLGRLRRQDGRRRHRASGRKRATTREWPEVATMAPEVEARVDRALARARIESRR